MEYLKITPCNQEDMQTMEEQFEVNKHLVINNEGELDQLAAKLKSLRVHAWPYRIDGVAKREEQLEFGFVTLVGLRNGASRALNMDLSSETQDAFASLVAVFNASPAVRGGKSANEETLINDLMEVFSTRRLSASDKTIITNMIYDLCDEYGRNRHERAVLIPRLLGGANTMCGDKPYEPRLGGVASTINRLKYVDQVLSRLATLRGDDPAVINRHITQVFESLDAYPDVEDYLAVRQMAIKHRLRSVRAALVEGYKELSRLLVGHTDKYDLVYRSAYSTQAGPIPDILMRLDMATHMYVGYVGLLDEYKAPDEVNKRVLELIPERYGRRLKTRQLKAEKAK